MFLFLYILTNAKWKRQGNTSRVKEAYFRIYTELFISPSGISDPCGTVAGMGTPKGSMSTEGETLQVSVLPYRYSIFVDFWGLLTNVSRTRSTVSADGPGRPLCFAAHRQPLCWNFMYHSQIVFDRRWFCAVHGSKPPLHRHNWLSFGKFKDTERFLIHCARHFFVTTTP